MADARRELQRRQDELVDGLITGELSVLDSQQFARTREVIMRKIDWVASRRRATTFLQRLRRVLGMR